MGLRGSGGWLRGLLSLDSGVGLGGLEILGLGGVDVGFSAQRSGFGGFRGLEV